MEKCSTIFGNFKCNGKFFGKFFSFSENFWKFYGQFVKFSKFRILLWNIFLHFSKFCGNFFKILLNFRKCLQFFEILWKIFENFVEIILNYRVGTVGHAHAHAIFYMLRHDMECTRAYRFWHAYAQTNLACARADTIWHAHEHESLGCTCEYTCGHAHAQAISDMRMRRHDMEWARASIFTQCAPLAATDVTKHPRHLQKKLGEFIFLSACRMLPSFEPLECTDFL
jgi:hypothetical protein